LITVSPSNMKMTGYWNNDFLVGEEVPVAMHFVGVNRGREGAWSQYKACMGVM
jgi:hypothetical protein